MPRIEPRDFGGEARTLPLCYPTTIKHLYELIFSWFTGPHLPFSSFPHIATVRYHLHRTP